MCTFVTSKLVTKLPSENAFTAYRFSDAASLLCVAICKTFSLIIFQNALTSSTTETNKFVVVANYTYVRAAGATLFVAEQNSSTGRRTSVVAGATPCLA